MCKIERTDHTVDQENPSFETRLAEVEAERDRERKNTSAALEWHRRAEARAEQAERALGTAIDRLERAWGEAIAQAQEAVEEALREKDETHAKWRAAEERLAAFGESEVDHVRVTREAYEAMWHEITVSRERRDADGEPTEPENWRTMEWSEVVEAVDGARAGGIAEPHRTGQAASESYCGGLWYNWIPGVGYEEYDTAERAKSDAEHALAEIPPRDDCWPEDIERVEWGRLVPLGKAEAYDYKETPDSSVHDYTVSYRLVDVAGAKEINVAREGTGYEQD